MIQVEFQVEVNLRIEVVSIDKQWAHVWAHRLDGGSDNNVVENGLSKITDIVFGNFLDIFDSGGHAGIAVMGTSGMRDTSADTSNRDVECRVDLADVVITVKLGQEVGRC